MIHRAVNGDIGELGLARSLLGRLKTMFRGQPVKVSHILTPTCVGFSDPYDLKLFRMVQGIRSVDQRPLPCTHHQCPNWQVHELV